MTLGASEDLMAIWCYLAENAGIRPADRLAAEFEQWFERLAENPRLGHARHDVAPSRLLFWVLHRYLIVYDSQTNPIRIVRVLHGARDLKTIFDSREDA
ncbi:MAG: type II toxin-antitoxin system RelE/ParE family toxin [Phycisphaerales bacterium]